MRKLQSWNITVEKLDVKHVTMMERMGVFFTSRQQLMKAVQLLFSDEMVVYDSETLVTVCDNLAFTDAATEFMLAHHQHVQRAESGSSRRRRASSVCRPVPVPSPLCSSVPGSPRVLRCTQLASPHDAAATHNSSMERFVEVVNHGGIFEP